MFTLPPGINFSWPFILIVLGAIGSFVWRMIGWYADTGRRARVVIGATWLGWFLALSVSLLLPLDVAAARYGSCLRANAAAARARQCPMPVAYVGHVTLVDAWNGLYWSTFILTWFVYPVAQSYYSSAAFSRRDRLLEALRENALFYALATVAGALLLLWVSLSASYSTVSYSGLAIAMSNAWALTLLICLLGHGLVEVPRRLWRASTSFEMRHKLARFQVAHAAEARDRASDVLHEVALQLRDLSDAVPADHSLRRYLDRVVAECPLALADVALAREESGLVEDADATAPGRPSPTDAGVDLHRMIVSHRRTLHVAIHNDTKARALYDEQLREAFALEDMMAEADNVAAAGGVTALVASYLRAPAAMLDRRIHYSFSLEAPPTTWSQRLAASVDYHYRLFLRPYVYYALFVGASALSVLVFWCEVTLSVTRLSIFSRVADAYEDNDVGLLLIVFVPLAYLSVCAYSSLFRLRIFSYYQLVPHQQTDDNSLLFSAAYLCRLAAPLAYNYLNMLHLETNSEAAFTVVMSGMNAVPALARKFNFYFPLMVIALGLATLLNVYTKCLDCLGVRRFQFDDDFDDDRLDTGRAILQIERRRNAARYQQAVSLPSPARAMTPTPTASTTAGATAAVSRPTAAAGATGTRA